MYSKGDYDLAGFCVGVVEKEAIIDGSKVSDGDTMIALASSGPHSNGYSLIRKVIEVSEATLSQDCGGKSLGDALLAPTKIYVSSILSVLKTIDIHAMAHITGGGLLENIPRVLPNNTQAVIQKDSWDLPEVFNWLQKSGNIEAKEMYRTFNCGVGMVVIVANEDADAAIDLFNQNGETAWKLGQIEKLTGDEQVCFK